MNRTELYPYQIEGVRAIRDFDGRALLADDLGLGKTIQSLYYAWRYLPKDVPGPVVCVVPSHLKLKWKREAEQHLGIMAEILSGERADRDKLPPLDRNQVYVVNYEILVPPHWKAGAPVPRDSWTHWLLRLKPRLLILDEAVRAKNAEANCTRACRRLAQATPHVLALTGTPLANRPTDLWAILNLVRPELFPSFLEFALEFTHARKIFGRWDFKGAKNLDVLHGILKRECLIRRRKADVLSQLPAITHSVIEVEVDMVEYRRAEDDYVSWLEAQTPGAGARAAKAESLVRTTGLKTLAGRLKVDSVIRESETIIEETGGKILLGALHYSVTEPLMKHFGRRAVLIDGRLSHVEKEEGFHRFNHDPDLDACVGNIQSCGTGWDCKSTSDAALVEFPWRPDDVTQFAGRIHGLGRGLPGSPAHMRYFVAAGTIESDLCAVLQRKSLWAAQAIDGDPGASELDLHDLVVEMVRERAAARRRDSP